MKEPISFHRNALLQQKKENDRKNHESGAVRQELSFPFPPAVGARQFQDRPFFPRTERRRGLSVPVNVEAYFASMAAIWSALKKTDRPVFGTGPVRAMREVFFAGRTGHKECFSDGGTCRKFWAV